MKSKIRSADSRIELRINIRDKAYLSRAAELRGEPVSAFARSVLVREAKRIVEGEQAAVLSTTQSRRFLKTLDRPFAPNAALSKALAKGDKLGL